MAAAASAAASYIGSVISLTSKSEIRYEGVLYTINTEESSIGLKNVRSFGTEGRKKDGQQIPASDKIYEYILFRGSDIKDLQVKSSHPAQPATLLNDPAIIQSHYPRPASTSLPPPASTMTADPASQNSQSGIQMPPLFQGNLPPYQPGDSLPPWNSSPMPSSANGAGLTMPPMYWPGFYTPPNGFSHLQPPPFLQLPHGLTVPQALQQPVQYPGLNASLPPFPRLPEFTYLPQPGSGNNLSQNAGLATSMPAPALSSTTATESSASQLPNKLSVSASMFSAGLTPPSVNPLISAIEHSMSQSQGMSPLVNMVNNKPVSLPDSSVSSASSNKHMNIPVPTYLPSSQPPSANIAANAATFAEPVTLVTPGPGQLLPTVSSTVLSTESLEPASVMIPSSKAASSPVSSSQVTSSIVSPSQVQFASSTVPSPQQLEPNNKDRDTKQPEWKAKQHAVAPSNKEPLLPAPKPTLQKPVGASLYIQYNNRGRGRGRGRGRVYEQSCPITKFTEDFDFMAMNEKFNKDEVWGHLGKSKGELNDDPNEYEDYVLEDDTSPAKPDVKPMYVKGDFFDSLSCNTFDNGGGNGRIKFSEQRKIDTETFGDSARHRPMGMRGGRGPRGGPRGRGYYGRGYGYTGRGRGYSGYTNHQ
ncbi:hypothetical protein ABZP36_012573 [Zizania latifolia]